MDQSGATDFENHVLASEHMSLNKRRSLTGRPSVSASNASQDAPPIYDTVGLALSGGGIRSAAISLGVLQALHTCGVLEHIDYLSTVSGGGYIGGSLAATMTRTSGEFVFVDEAASPHTPAVAHLRNYSNYLLAGGRRSTWSAIAIIVRGLVSNLAIVLPFILFLSAATLNIFRSPEYLMQPLLYFPFAPRYFSLTILLIAGGFVLFLLWALYLSFLPARKLSDQSSRLPVLGAGVLVGIGVAFFIELQPLLLYAMTGRAASSWSAWIAITIHFLALGVIPATIVIAALFQRRLGNLLEQGRDTSRPAAVLSAAAGRTVILATAAELPLIVWVTFLSLTLWGLSPVSADTWLQELSFQLLRHFPIGLQAQLCSGPEWSSLLQSRIPIDAIGQHAYALCSSLAVAYLYVAVGITLLVLAAFLKPNALSLHGLYRDRLKQAFFFNPTTPSDRGFEPLSDVRVSELSAAYTPYQVINAALNIQGTSYANLRGRDADFFMFSPNYVGSTVTGYVPTTEFENAQRGFDLATAVAVSGAAVSSSMGANSIRLLAPTLALLNIRLGYWLRNPKRLKARKGIFRRLSSIFWRASSSLWSEATGQLYTDRSDEVYVTDGGHIENLGLYELLRRRCCLIICLDAEADLEIRLSSFMALQRYAGIDLGVQIELPWEAIQQETVKWMGYDPLAITSTSRPEARHGPHAAIGTIRYRGGQTGFLLYIKASLTGDERDYVRDYARRYPEFPHERTGKQFFNEEQFEVYRALGFHMAEGVFSGTDQVNILGGVERPELFGGKKSRG
jgi:hypothetical protein